MNNRIKGRKIHSRDIIIDAKVEENSNVYRNINSGINKNDNVNLGVVIILSVALLTNPAEKDKGGSNNTSTSTNMDSQSTDENVFVSPKFISVITPCSTFSPTGKLMTCLK